MQGVRNGISIFLSTGYCVGTVIAMLLNTILPADVPVAYADDEDLALEDDTEADPSKAKELQDAPEEAAADKSSEEVEEEASP
jgi:NCS2 family nucleobase:cation symporter-2